MELVATVAAAAGTTNADAARILDSFRDVVQANVKRGANVSYPGLGKFSQVSRKARMARNPRTGAAVKVPASKAPKFTPSARLKAVVAGAAPAPRLARAR
jgi:DNA-binding protein HU-beta